MPLSAFGFGYQKSKSKQASESGLRGTDHFGGFAAGYAGLGNQLASQTQGYANSPYGTFQGQTGAQMAGTDPNTGLPASLTGYLNTTAGNMFSQASAGGSFKGQNSPENTGAIVGSSLQNIGQYLTPYIVDWSKYSTGLAEEAKKSRLGMMQASLGAMAPGLGNQYAGSSSALGIQGDVKLV